MSKLVLRNNRLDNTAWLATAAVFAVAGLAAFGGLVVANLRDPKARWMGPKVSSPQAIYLCFEVVTLLLALAMFALAIWRAKKVFDRSIQLVIDHAGIHDLRSTEGTIPWSDVADLRGVFQYSRGIATHARLNVVMNSGQTIAIDTLGLDQDPKSILTAAQQMMKAGD